MKLYAHDEVAKRLVDGWYRLVTPKGKERWFRRLGIRRRDYTMTFRRRGCTQKESDHWFHQRLAAETMWAIGTWQVITTPEVAELKKAGHCLCGPVETDGWQNGEDHQAA